MRGSAVLAGALVAGAFGGCGGDGGGVAADVEAAARDAFPGYEIGAAECPDGVEVTEGVTFRCTLEIEGQEATIEVAPAGKGALRLDPVEALVAVGRIEEILAADLGGEEEITVDCGDRAVLVRRPGDTFECEADGGDGATARLLVTVEDDDGNTSYELV